jgi:hypothetical protein
VSATPMVSVSTDRERHDVIVKQRFAAALAEHEKTCTRCIIGGPVVCPIGSLLQRCAEHGTARPL